MWPTSYILIAGGLVLALFGYKSFHKKDLAKGIGFVAAALGVMMYLGYVSMAPFTAGLGSDVTAPSTGVTSGVTLPIDTLSGAVMELGSNSYSSVDGLIKLYDASANPTDPNANPIDTITILNGAGSSTAGKVRVNTPYRVIFVNDSTNKAWYSVDLGIVTPVPESNYNKQTGKATFFIEGANAPRLTGTLDDSMSEGTNASANINGGNFTTTSNCDETAVMSANGTQALWFDESVGAGSFYFDPLISVSGGANKAVKNLVLQHQWDNSNPPSGNEVTACSLSLLTGANPNLPSDCLGAWKNQAKISLFNGQDVTSGTLGRFRITYTVDESAWANTELWTVVIADLGGRNAQDVGLSTGATDQVIQIGSCA